MYARYGSLLEARVAWHTGPWGAPQSILNFHNPESRLVAMLASRKQWEAQEAERRKVRAMSSLADILISRTMHQETPLPPKQSPRASTKGKARPGKRVVRKPIRHEARVVAPRPTTSRGRLVVGASRSASSNRDDDESDVVEYMEPDELVPAHAIVGSEPPVAGPSSGVATRHRLPTAAGDEDRQELSSRKEGVVLKPSLKEGVVWVVLRGTKPGVYDDPYVSFCFLYQSVLSICRVLVFSAIGSSVGAAMITAAADKAGDVFADEYMAGKVETLVD